ncbi:hypothetical protein [Streptomyces niveus]|uniref:hypothetical protein n=1 Tax=Streptomyces niveus TaxID=193462 RepID=UPI00114CE483|nr:hypothetical protein [Streptomyces niveus]
MTDEHPCLLDGGLGWFNPDEAAGEGRQPGRPISRRHKSTHVGAVRSSFNPNVFIAFDMDDLPHVSSSPGRH